MSEAHAPLVLDANENPLGPSPRAIEAMGQAAAKANRYPDPAGRALKERLAGMLGVTPTHLALGNGSNELIELLVHLHVAPGDEVVVSKPTFVMYGLSTRLLGGTLVEVPGRGLGHAEHDLPAMLQAIGPRTRLVIICNPNNPTGAVVRAAAWRDFMARVPAGVVVVSDEAYHEYVDDPEYPRTLDDVGQGAPLVVLRTFSKIHALAGARVGYAIARPDLAAGFDRVRLPYNVASISQAGALGALDDAEHVARSRALVQAGRKELARALMALGLTVHPSQGNFLFVDWGRDAAALGASLERAGILVRPLASWGAGPTYARVTIGTKAQNARLVETLGALLAAPPAAQA